MNVKIGDLVYFIGRTGIGELGIYIGKQGITNTYRYTIMWTDKPDDTSNESLEALELYRQQYLDFRKQNG